VVFKKATKVEKKKPISLDLLNAKQAKELRTELSAITCGEVAPRQKAKVIGQISSIRIAPRGQSHWLEVVIKDGTGIVNGWFFGKKSIPGMVPGANVLFEGLVQFDEGEMTIANPYYEFI